MPAALISANQDYFLKAQDSSVSGVRKWSSMENSGLPDFVAAEVLNQRLAVVVRSF